MRDETTVLTPGRGMTTAQSRRGAWLAGAMFVERMRERMSRTDHGGQGSESVRAQPDGNGLNGAIRSQHAPCPVCGHADTTAFVRDLPDRYSWWQCDACDLQFASPMQAGDVSFYQSLWVYRQERHPGTAKRRLRSTKRVWEYREILDYEPVSRGQLLDIGCGPGDVLYYAQERYGYTVAGVDFNEMAVRAARKIYNLQTVVCGSWPEDAGPIQAGTFDRVTMFHIVEHVADPVKAIRSAALALKPAGLLGVAVPVLRQKPWLRHSVLDQPPHHLTLWSERALTRAFDAAGLEPVRITRRPFMGEDLLVLAQDRFSILRHQVISRILWRVVRRLIVLPVILLRRVLPPGYVVAGIARTPANPSNESASRETVNSGDEYRH